MLFCFLYGVPKCLAVCVFRRSVRRQEDFGMGYTALVGVVAGLAVILAEQLLPGAVGGRCDGGLSRTPRELCCVKMVKCDSQSPPNCSAALWALTASITMPLTSGMEKMRSTREKNSTSPNTFTNGDTLSTAAPRVIRRCALAVRSFF